MSKFLENNSFLVDKASFPAAILHFTSLLLWPSEVSRLPKYSKLFTSLNILPLILMVILPLSIYEILMTLVFFLSIFMSYDLAVLSRESIIDSKPDSVLFSWDLREIEQKILYIPINWRILLVYVNSFMPSVLYIGLKEEFVYLFTNKCCFCTF